MDISLLDLSDMLFDQIKYYQNFYKKKFKGKTNLKIEATRDQKSNNIEILVRKPGIDKPISDLNLKITDFEESILNIVEDDLNDNDSNFKYIDKKENIEQPF